LTDKLDKRLDALQVIAGHYLSEAKTLEEKAASKMRVRVSKVNPKKAKKPHFKVKI